jgi:hypothetical protein
VSIWPDLVRHWGSTSSERARPYACDRLLAESDPALFRAVAIEAPSAVVFRWLCQLRAAPYSYDLLDNRGRRSPQKLTPGLEQLRPGQRVMTIFELVEFETDRSITLRHRGPLFGELAVTYRVDDAGPGRCRLVVKLLPGSSRGPLGAVARLLLPPGDLVMMRRQLLNLKRLAEGSPCDGAG